MPAKPRVAVLHTRPETALEDYYWPLRFRHVAGRWRRETCWGRLFDEYQRQGTLAPTNPV